MNKYKVGDIVTGCITGIEKYGFFVNIDNEYSGLIHISEISNNYVRNINDYARIGEIIQAKVIEVPRHNHIKLSIKDIDYRISKRKIRKIEETSKAFSTLTIMLNQWIEEKMYEINQKKLKKYCKQKQFKKISEIKKYF